MNSGRIFLALVAALFVLSVLGCEPGVPDYTVKKEGQCETSKDFAKLEEDARSDISGQAWVVPWAESPAPSITPSLSFAITCSSSPMMPP